MEDKKYNSCIVCDGQLDYYLTGGDYLYSTDNRKFNLYSCGGCKLKMINPLCEQEQLVSYYPDNYYAFSQLENESFFKKIKIDSIGVNYKKKENALYNLFFKFLNKIIDVEMYFGVPLRIRGAKKFLDIGCGDGEFVKIMAQNGWDAYGYEIAEREKAGRIFKHPDFTQEKFNDIKFDCIRIWHVFEHVINPREYLKKISSILADDGVVYIGLPNTNSINAWIFRKYWLGYDMPRHQINYNLGNLRKLLGKFGFKFMKYNYSGNMLFSSLSLLLKCRYNINIRFPLVLSIISHFFYKKDCLTILVKLEK